MNYTSEEILAATTAIVRDAVRRQYGALGNKESGQTLTDIQDAAAGVFLLFKNAPFYVLFLGTERLSDLVTNELETLNELINNVTDAGRNTTPVSSVSSLNNASVALGALAGAANRRAANSAGTFSNIEDVPAWQRFDANVQRFLDEHSKNIKAGGAIVQTPAGAKQAIPAQLNDIETQHAELNRRAELLANGLDDFNSLQLRATLQSAILTQAKEVLDENITTLKNLTPQQRLSELRSITLSILAARAIVRSYSSLTAPTLFALIDGAGSPFADADHPATPAALTADVFAPYPITGDSSQLDFFLDGSSSITSTVAIQGSFVARLDGLIAEPFEILASPDPDQNDEFTIEMTEELDVPVTLTAGAAVPIETIVADINTAISAVSPSPPLVAEAYFNPIKLRENPVTTTTGPDAFQLVNAAVNLTTQQVEIGDKVSVLSGDNAGNLYTIAAITPASPPSTGAIIEVTLLSGTHVAATNDTIEIGAPDRLLRIRITDAGALAALNINARIDLPGDTDVSERALQTLGFQPPTGIASRRSSADDVINSVQLASGSAVGLTTRLEATKEFVATLFTGQGHTVSNTSLKYVLFKLREDGVSFSTTAGVTTFEVSDTSNIATGDVVAIRASSGANDVDAWGFITVTGPTTFEVTTWNSDDVLFVAPPADSTNALIDVGPNLSIPNDCVLRIAESSLNDGLYAVTYSGSFPNSIPFELPLGRALPFITQGGQPVVNNVELGQERVVFNSTDTTLATKVRATNGDTGSGPNPLTAVDRFFTSPPAEAVGLTTFFQLPEDPKTLQTGDVLELYESSYNTVSQSFVINDLELGDLLIVLEEGMATDTVSFNFTTEGTTPPFARVRHVRQNNFDVFKEAVETWLATEENEDQFFRNLDAKINPVLSGNPSIVQINDAKLALQDLVTSLNDLQAILGSYQVDPVTQVDVLIDSFLEQGADRAVDLLLEGRFTTFFGLSIDGQSYAGDVMAKIKEIQRLDLPVRKVRRPDAGFDQVVAQWQEPDFEFDQSDIEDIDEVDIPADTDKPFPGQF